MFVATNDNLNERVLSARNKQTQCRMRIDTFDCIGMQSKAMSSLATEANSNWLNKQSLTSALKLHDCPGEHTGESMLTKVLRSRGKF